MTFLETISFIKLAATVNLNFPRKPKQKGMYSILVSFFLEKITYSNYVFENNFNKVHVA